MVGRPDLFDAMLPDERQTGCINAGQPRASKALEHLHSLGILIGTGRKQFEALETVNQQSEVAYSRSRPYTT